MTEEWQDTERCSSQNERAPYEGSLTLAHAGDPTPETWIVYMLAETRLGVKSQFEPPAMGSGPT